MIARLFGVCQSYHAERLVFDAGQITSDKVSSVQYMKFHLRDEQSEALREEGTVLRAIVTHPHYEVQAVLGENVRRAIQGDPM